MAQPPKIGASLKGDPSEKKAGRDRKTIRLEVNGRAAVGSRRVEVAEEM